MSEERAASEVDWLTPAARMPWPVQVPFRMRPNLERLDAEAPALLLRDGLAEVYQRERTKVMTAHPDRAAVGAANAAVLSAIGRLAPDLQEDFVVLRHDGDALRTEYLAVCFPSRWDPREKLGLDFMAIHQPVADNEMLQAAGPNLMAMAFMKQPMLRHVWLIVPNPALDQHPDRNVGWWREALADPSPLLPRLYFRVERQTTWPLPQQGRAVFFIRLLMSPLLDVLRAATGRPAELAASLRSMTPAIVAYRGMTDALARMLSELDALT